MVTLLACFYIFDENSMISYILFGISVTIFLIEVFLNRGKISLRIEKYHLYVLAFALFCLASSIWAWNRSYAIEKSVTIIEILVCMSIIYMNYQDDENVDPLINAMMWAGFVVTIYAYTFYGTGNIQRTILAGERLENAFSNINAIGMLAAIEVIICVYRGINEGKRWCFLLAIPSTIMIIASGSRKALVMMVLGIILLFIIKNFSKHLFYTLLRTAIIVLVSYFLIAKLAELPAFSGINERMSGLFALVTGHGVVDHSAWLRQQYILIGLNQFKETPLLGIGMGNARMLAFQYFGHNAYLHNNFVELLANGGIVGFAFYYSIYVYAIANLLKYRRYWDHRETIILVLIILQLVMDYGAVSYYSKSMYFYFLIFYLQIQMLKRKAVNYEQ